MDRFSRCGGVLFLAVVISLAAVHGPGTRAVAPGGGIAPEVLHVDHGRGNDAHPGSQTHPLKSISAALAKLPDPVARNVTIELAPGRYPTTGGRDMPPDRLDLACRMKPGVVVRLIGGAGAKDEKAVLAWEGGTAMVNAGEGEWCLENLQIGSGSTRQRRGVQVSGPAHVQLKDVTFRTRSHSDAGIYVHRGGKVSLYGAIRLNEHLHAGGGDETFCGIIADDHGLVQYGQREGASLDVGNGSLSASYYGCIRLGCETARITSWGDQSNTLAINNGGRIDLHGTHVTLRAGKERNTPIGLEHDGHILGEGARVIIEGTNHMAIALQKASTFTCNDLELRGQFGRAVWAASGSMFVGRFLSDAGGLEAATGAGIHVEEIRGKFTGPLVATRCGRISLPDRDIDSSSR